MSYPDNLDEIRGLARYIDADPRYQNSGHPVRELAGHALDLCREVETLRARLARFEPRHSTLVARHAFGGNPNAVGFEPNEPCPQCGRSAYDPAHFKNGGVLCDVNEGHCCCGAAHHKGETRG